MKAHEYLAKLGEALSPMEAAEREDFLAEMASHIEDLGARHPGSGEEELVDALTPPERLAAELLAASDSAGSFDASAGRGAPGAGETGPGIKTPEAEAYGPSSRDGRGAGPARPRERLRQILEALARGGLEGSDADEFVRDFPLGASEGEIRIEGLRVELLSADLSVEAGDGGSVRLVARGDGCEERLEFEVEGGSLSIREKAKPGTELDSLELCLPDGVRSLVISTLSGDVRVEGLELGLSVKTTSGDVELREVPGASVVETASGDVSLEACGPASIRTASGDVEAGDVEGDLVVKTASGDVAIHGIEGRIGIETASGDTEVEGVVGPFAVKTSSGGTRISCDGAFPGGIASSVSGDIELEFCGMPDASVDIATKSGEVEVAGRDARSGSFDLGSGGPELKLRSVSGDISLGW